MFKHIRDEWEWYGYACCMDGGVPSRWKFAYYMAKDWINSLVCRWKGHDWEDESYGGPDSGCMAATCKRCGYSFHTPLY